MERQIFGDLTIAVDRATSGWLSLAWTGRSNSRDPAHVLDPLFRSIADEAQANDKSVEMRFDELEFFNSATITSLIQFVQEMSRRETRLVLIFDSARRWQKLSFEVLRIFEKADGLLELRARES
jgi:hypothetical protein